MKKTSKFMSLVLALVFLVSPFQVKAASNYGGFQRASVDMHAELFSQNIQETRAYYIETYVETPKGSHVPVWVFLSDMPDSERTRVHGLGDSVSTSDYRLHQATMLYNCHSYAWHSQDTSNNTNWMNNPAQYYSDNDGSYYEVSTPIVGDIICYYDNNGTRTNYDDDTNIHSGIIVEIYSSNLTNGLAGNYTVESKWGAWGLYRHNGYECPYTNHILTVDAVMEAENITRGSLADYVKYYRRSGHAHNFDTYNDTGNDDYHECICDCGMIIHKAHNWVLRYGKSLEQRGVNYVPEYYCALCGAFSLNPN